VIGADDAPQVFGVESARQRGGAYKITEHHRDDRPGDPCTPYPGGW
jgi:hypothetical protein